MMKKVMLGSPKDLIFRDLKYEQSDMEWSGVEPCQGGVKEQTLLKASK